MRKFQQDLSNGFYAILSLPATAMGLALSVQIAALSWILTTQYNLDIHDIGLVWAAGPLAGIFGQVIIGILSDKVWFWNGRRRPFILIGGLIGSLSLLSLPYIGVISSALGLDGVVGVALAIALTLDMAINISFNPTRAIIADVTPAGVSRTKGFSWMQTVSGTISVAAYGIGVIWDNYVLIYAGAFITFLLAIFPTLLIEEPRMLPGAKIKDGGRVATPSLMKILATIKPLWGFLIYDIYALVLRLGGFTVDHFYVEYACVALSAVLIARTVLEKPAPGDTLAGNQIEYKKVLAAHSFSWVGIQTIFVFLVPVLGIRLSDLDDLTLGSVSSFAFLTLNAVAAILPVFALEPIARRIGRVRTHALSLMVMSVAFAYGYVAGFGPVQIYATMLFAGVGWAAIVSLPFAIMSQKVDQSQMGLYMGLFNLSVVLPQLLVSLGVGLFVSRVDDKGIIFMIASVSIAISAALWLFVKRAKAHPSEMTPLAQTGASH